MLVKSTKPGSVFWDQFQEVTIYGTKSVEVKPSHFILELLNKGLIEEVKAEPKKEDEPELSKAEAAKLKKEAMIEKSKETA